MAESEQGSSSYNPLRIRDRILAAVERARSQDVFSELVEELQISRELTSLRGRPDTVVIVDEEENSTASSVSSNTRHRSTPSSTNANASPATEPAGNTDATTEASSEENAQNTDLRRELNRLRNLTQNRDLQQFWIILSRVLPFFLILCCKFLIDNISTLLNIVASFTLFCFANSMLLASLRENKYYNLLKTSLCVIVALGLQFFFFGVDSVFTVLSFKVHPLLTKTFFSTFCVVLVADLTVKILSIQVKVIIAALPSYLLANKRQRRVFQWLEYGSQIYQFIIPMPQWCRFLTYAEETGITNYSGYCLAIFYVLYKMFHFLELGKNWYNSTRYVCRLTSVGSKPTRSEVEYQQQCTICYGDFDVPVKLSCGHVFCEECISTWLDKEHTCPMCRAVVAKEDNTWKGGDTSLVPQVF